MTRGEAKNIIHMKFTRPYSFGDISNLIDKIFDDFESRTCENCKHYQPITRNGTLFKRCFFLGTVGDIITCGRWEQN